MKFKLIGIVPAKVKLFIERWSNTPTLYYVFKSIIMGMATQHHAQCSLLFSFCANFVVFGIDAGSVSRFS